MFISTPNHNVTSIGSLKWCPYNTDSRHLSIWKGIFGDLISPTQSSPMISTLMYSLSTRVKKYGVIVWVKLYKQKNIK